MSHSTLRTRFAPSPTGLMHVGNAFAAIQCQQWALSHNAKLLLRIEDIDYTRCRAIYTQAIIDDLQWLGITWDAPIIKQSERLDNYQQALHKLRENKLIYPCFCSRKNIQQELQAMTSAPHKEQAIDPYPGICRHLSSSEQQRRMQYESFAWRLDIEKSCQQLSLPLSWTDHKQTQHTIISESLGDFIIARKDIGVSYHLAVVVDDALQGISHVIRGNDLRSSTPIHRLLQALLELPSPIYHHHRLLLDSEGKRLAKRNHSTTLKSLREAGISAQILRHALMQNSSHWPFQEHQSASSIAQQLGRSS